MDRNTAMKKVLVLAAVSEGATGLALLVVPSLVGRLLLGEQLTGVAIPVARVLGISGRNQMLTGKPHIWVLALLLSAAAASISASDTSCIRWIQILLDHARVTMLSRAGSGRTPPRVDSNAKSSCCIQRNQEVYDDRQV